MVANATSSHTRSRKMGSSKALQPSRPLDIPQDGVSSHATAPASSRVGTNESNAMPKLSKSFAAALERKGVDIATLATKSMVEKKGSSDVQYFADLNGYRVTYVDQRIMRM